MATPTSAPRPSPSRPVNHLTPAAASSPPPPSSGSGTNRSIPSPAYLPPNQAAKRPLQYRNVSAQTPAGGTPMVRTGTNASTPMARTNTSRSADSPAVLAAGNMLMDGYAGIPRGLGLTPQGTGLTPMAMAMAGAVGSISGLGGLGAHDREEERKRHMEVIVGMLAGRWGFVSQEGVERCAKRLGLEYLWEEGMSVGEERKRTLSIAGKGLLVDVQFNGDEVVGVTLSLPGSVDVVGEKYKEAAGLLRRDLSGGSEQGSYVPLKSFVDNLESMARMDSLGGEEISCFDAVDGIFKSLERLHKWEMEKVQEGGFSQKEAEIMCKQSGIPKMHTRQRVGLAVQFWLERRLLVEKKETTAEAMDVDSVTTEDEDDESAVYSVTVECEAYPAKAYPSIRISDKWISEDIKRPRSEGTESNEINNLSIDWLESLSLIGQQANPPIVENTTDSTSPDVRFIAKFHPPIVVPLQIALSIHQSVDSPILHESILPTTYESLILADIDPPNLEALAPRTVEKLVKSYNPSKDTSASHIHKYTLFTQPQDFARLITELPFSHPRQIIDLLPTLRQWALTGSILRRAFAPNSNLENDPPASPTDNPTPTTEPQSFNSLTDELADFLSSPLPTSTNPPNSKTRAIDVSLTTTPLPRFNIHFPNPRYGGKLASVGFSVGSNGVIEGVDVDDGAAIGIGGGGDNDNEEEKREGRERVRLRERIGRVLGIGEDLGVGVEWLVGG